MAREALTTIGMIVGAQFGPVGMAIGSFIGAAVGSVIDPLTFQGPQLGDASVQTSRPGVPIPILYGLTHVVGNLIAINPPVTTTVKTGSKKSGITKSEKRTQTFAIGIGTEIGGLVRVWRNNKLVYDARDGSTFPAADNAEFLSGITLYLGTETQLPDPELETNFGVGTTPSYKGLSYIVFNSLDITQYGSIPSFRFEVWASNDYVPNSWNGYTYTQDNYLSTDPSFTHPFEGRSFDEITMSCVFRPSQPNTDENGFAFSINGFGTTTSISIRRRPVSGQIYIAWSISTNLTGSGTTQVASGKFEFTDHAGWAINQWYWVGISYDSGALTVHACCRNLTLGTDVVEIADTTLHNPDPVEWPADLSASADSGCCWGCNFGEPNQTRLLGTLLQVFIHNKYINLASAVNRNKFCCTIGVIDLGLRGENPFGEIPLVYIPDGYPENNRGSLFIGTNDNFYELVQYERDLYLPPVCSKDVGL